MYVCMYTGITGEGAGALTPSAKRQHDTLVVNTL